MERILLVEPGYKNKFPPLGLMKLATYHRNKGDSVGFYKGEAPYTDISAADRVYITTLFTFHYDITLKCIRHYLKYSNRDSIFIGGIAATLMPGDFKRDTGVDNVIEGRLLSSNMLGYDDNVNIDVLPLDYDILDDILYDYAAKDNYFVYTTRGCPRGCEFCAVRILEPEFRTTNNLIAQMRRVDRVYGAKRNLIVMDNNILYSPKLGRIIEDIRSLGFTGKPEFVAPNEFDEMMNKMRRRKGNGSEISRQLVQACDMLKRFEKRVMRYKKFHAEYSRVIEEVKRAEDVFGTLTIHSEYLKAVFEKYRVKSKLVRYVDFNQGIDARLINQRNMELLSTLPIRPFRLACDSVADMRTFTYSTKMAFGKGIRHFSNYMLYNWKDKPEDLWIRLHNAVLLYGRLGDGVDAFSFPMRYAPIDAKDRSYVGLHWNKKYLNAINVIINVTNGVVAKEKDFFKEAFGANLREYMEILSMPDEFIRHRHYFKKIGLLKYWKRLFHRLSEEEKKYLLGILYRREESEAALSGNHPRRIIEILILYRLNKSQFDRGERTYRSVLRDIKEVNKIGRSRTGCRFAD